MYEFATAQRRPIARCIPGIAGLALLLFACAGCDSQPQRSWEDLTDARLDRILADFASDDAEVRKRAAARLAKVAEYELTNEQCTRLLHAASRDWIADDEADPCDALIGAVFTQPDDVDWKLVVVDFGHYSEAARWEVASALTDKGDMAAAEIYLQLVEKYADRGLILPTGFDAFLESSEATKKLLPVLLSHAKSDDFGYFVQLYALNAAKAGIVAKADLAPFAESTATMYRTMRERQRTREQPEGDDWIWTVDYEGDRAHASLLLDLMGHLPLEAVQPDLTEALASRDPRLQYFAAKSLLAHGQEVSSAAIESIAASAEYRNSLYETLVKIGRSDLMPAAYVDQEKFAESNMVAWLTYPAELGRTPHEIELMETFDNPDGTQRHYLFRFRTQEPHLAAKDGWMAGLSGPFEIAKMPTTEAGGDTFSTFTKWDEKSPADHFAEITGLLKESRARWGENAEAAEGE